jgi:hypothetical protein
MFVTERQLSQSQPAPRHACIVIDDPLLRENYGFLNYRALLRLMDRHNFFTTIAFIPVNFGRTDKKIAALFRERPDRFSICVHGCDHTGGEFASTDSDYLDTKVRLATARMVEHQRRTGVPFDRVMVFPQGKFSNAAMEALRRNSYLAAVNTDPTPVDGPFLSDFPFFQRATPEKALNPPAGPIFVVLHHDYFKSGYEQLADLVDALNSTVRDITWKGAGDIVRSCLRADRRKESSSDIRQDAREHIDLRGIEYYGYREYIRIRLRRCASECRDNNLSRNDFILNCAKKLLGFSKT